MTTKQRAYLKSLAMTMDPIFQIGKSSMTPSLTQAISEALDARELIKISVLQNCADDPRALAEMVAERTRSQVVQVIGKKIVLYKEGKDDKKKDKNVQSQRNGGREDDLFGTNRDLGDNRKSQFDEDDDGEDKISEFFNSKLPWDMTFAYSLTYGNNNRENKIIGNSIMISANADITPKWKAGVSTGYDFVQKGVTFTQLRFERDLLSWRMSFNWSPFGTNANWGFFIGIKSGVLSDIKWDKRSVINR